MIDKDEFMNELARTMYKDIFIKIQEVFQDENDVINMIANVLSTALEVHFIKIYMSEKIEYQELVKAVKYVLDNMYKNITEYIKECDTKIN